MGFPIAILTWKSAPALAFGNTVVMKPASLTPAIADKKWWEGSSGTGRLYVNGQMSAEAGFPQAFRTLNTTMSIGRAAGSPVSTAFSQPFAFTGTLEKVTVELQ